MIVVAAVRSNFLTYSMTIRNQAARINEDQRPAATMTVVMNKHPMVAPRGDGQGRAADKLLSTDVRGEVPVVREACPQPLSRWPKRAFALTTLACPCCHAAMLAVPAILLRHCGYSRHHLFPLRLAWPRLDLARRTLVRFGSSSATGVRCVDWSNYFGRSPSRVCWFF